MQSSYWQRQTPDKPLFPDLIWSRPETKAQAGKLGIIGGNNQGFAAAAEAFNEAAKAGIGTSRVLLPDSLYKTVGKYFEAGEFAPSTPSGSFASSAIAACIELGEWSDGLLIAGDLAHNSETAILLEKLSSGFGGRLTLSKDVIDYVTDNPQPVLRRDQTLLVCSFAQAQKIVMHSGFKSALQFSMDLIRLTNTLHEFSLLYPAQIIVKHHTVIIVASGGQISTTNTGDDTDTWRVKTAARAAVWWLQNPSQPFQAITTAIVQS